EEGARAVGRLLEGDRPTAVLCYNDICAFGVMLGLADRGLTPGRDMAVIGFDNLAEAALYRPALTTVAVGGRLIGQEAANLLLRRIKAPDGAPEMIVMPPKLIVRSSCGARPNHH
ncbi:MAG: substrate-binding domain-containing protein, partial [Rhizobiales bacterium]|nr:substrate-binding domain-containing protein [Hyphomicrobiales bacterium]